jgi:hypothetical protein
MSSGNISTTLLVAKVSWSAIAVRSLFKTDSPGAAPSPLLSLLYLTWRLSVSISVALTLSLPLFSVTLGLHLCLSTSLYLSCLSPLFLNSSLV